MLGWYIAAVIAAVSLEVVGVWLYRQLAGATFPRGGYAAINDPRRPLPGSPGPTAVEADFAERFPYA